MGVLVGIIRMILGVGVVRFVMLVMWRIACWGGRLVLAGVSCEELWGKRGGYLGWIEDMGNGSVGSRVLLVQHLLWNSALQRLLVGTSNAIGKRHRWNRR